MNLRVFSAGAVALAALLVFASCTNAQTLAFDYNNKQDGFGGDPNTVGYSFVVNKTITVTDLDIYDTKTFLSSNAIRTGIWNSAGILLTSGYVYVDGTGSSFTAPSGNVYFTTPIAPVALAPGDYVIGGLYGKYDAYVQSGTPVADPAVSYTEGLMYFFAFGKPKYAQSGNLFGPTFRYQSVGAFPDVPEPGVVAFGVIAAGGLLGLLARRRKAYPPPRLKTGQDCPAAASPGSS